MLLSFLFPLWKLRNKEVHGKEEATKQQKRKAKVAINVRALHKLEEIARPSDSFLYYQDVEKEIEQGTAVKLEEFIAMKTRPIHNSVKKWAKGAKSGVKSIVGWIRTGGKNNREIIERTERPLPTQSTQETKKENKRKG